MDFLPSFFISQYTEKGSFDLDSDIPIYSGWIIVNRKYQCISVLFIRDRHKRIVVCSRKFGFERKNTVLPSRLIRKSPIKDRIILLSTHIVSDLDYIATEVIIMKQGRFIQKGTPSQLMQKIEGKVWQLKCTDEELPRFQKQYKVSTITRKDETLAIRIIADEQPALLAEPVAANLEDLYLYYFSDSNEDKRKLFR